MLHSISLQHPYGMIGPDTAERKHVRRRRDLCIPFTTPVIGLGPDFKNQKHRRSKQHLQKKPRPHATSRTSKVDIHSAEHNDARAGLYSIITSPFPVRLRSSQKRICLVVANNPLFGGVERESAVKALRNAREGENLRNRPAATAIAKIVDCRFFFIS